MSWTDVLMTFAVLAMSMAIIAMAMLLNRLYEVTFSRKMVSIEYDTFFSVARDKMSMEDLTQCVAAATEASNEHLVTVETNWLKRALLMASYTDLDT